MLGDNNDLALRKLRNQWAKERALLEQENHLLSMNLLEIKGREISLKRVNSTLVNSIDLGRQTGVSKLQSRLARLEEENKHLKMKLTETSMEKKEIENKQQKLRVDNACMRQRTVYQLKEAKKAKDKYQRQLQKLEQEFDKLRYSNDHLLEAFRNSMLTSKNDESNCERCRCGCQQSSDSSDVAICAECIEEDGSQSIEGRCLHGQKSSRQRSSSRKRSAKCTKHKFVIENQGCDLRLSSEIRRSMHETVKQKGSFFEVFSLKSQDQINNKPNFTIGVPKEKLPNSEAKTRKQLNTFSRANTESEYTSNAQMFKHKRKSTVGYLGRIVGPSKQSTRTEEKANQFKKIDFQVQESQTLTKGPLFLNTSVINTLKGRTQGHPLSSVRMDYSNREPRESSLTAHRLIDEKALVEYNPRISIGMELPIPSDQLPSRKEQRTTHDHRGDSFRKEMQRGDNEKENVPELSTRLSSSNIFRSVTARESVQDCLNFNEVLREKLANIEQKLKFKVAN